MFASRGVRLRMAFCAWSAARLAVIRDYAKPANEAFVAGNSLLEFINFLPRAPNAPRNRRRFVTEAATAFLAR